ncbi:GAF domain-containing protein [Iningainema tapete]|uniref:GAF domain-containing protein n=1 Tax=Iningainema tapete BLCC-T55 TaxID=2748662 RepID=A0A8J6XN53_9CYAN|nr:GAF domain-containing protein [Iningainema tapete]MBD2776066.1 GAF domain-containing protein [Iningainema tapete BLCC-T55]
MVDKNDPQKNITNSKFKISSKTETEILAQSESQQLNSNSGVNYRVNRWGLRSKAIACAMIMVTLPILTVGSLAYFVVNQSTTKQITQSKSKSSAIATQRQLLLTIQIGTFIIALLCGGMAAIIANRLLQPIMVTAIAARKLRQGNLDTRLLIEGKDELADLGDSINYMAEQLQELQQKQAVEADQLKLLSNILLLIRSSLNSEDLFNITVKQARLALRTDRIVIYQFNANGGREVIAESVALGLPVALGKIIEDAQIDPDMIEAYKKGHVLAINNVNEAGFTSEQQRLMEKLQIKAKLVTPILKDHQIFGFLIAHHCFSPHIWQPYEINFLQQLATQVGLTLERVSLLEATQKLKDFISHIEGSFNREDVYNLAVEKIRQAIKAERAVIYKFDDGNWFGRVIAESVIGGWQTMVGAEFHDPCFQNYVEKYRQGRVQAINNIYQAGLSHCYIQQLELFAVQANLVAPIVLSDKLLGLLIVHQCSQPRIWQQSEIYLCEQFAKIVGLAIERTNFKEQIEKERFVTDEQNQQQEKLQIQLLQLLDNIEGASRGDLTVRGEVTYGEIGTIAVFFNSIMENLRSMINEVKLGATQLDEAIAQNSEAIGQLATKALQQTDQINHIISSIEKIRVTINEVAKNARKAVLVAQTASHSANVGSAAIDLTVENMINWQETVGETNEKVKRLEESSQKIGRVLVLIQQIAMQSNLLAINTGIEAARAQENPALVVIAEEVSTLAAKCSEVTQEIEGITNNIQLHTNVALQAVDLDTDLLTEGTRFAQHAQQSLSQIFSDFQQIDELVQSIAVTSLANVQTSQALINIIREIAQACEETSSASWQVSTSVEKTVEISQKLQTSINTFKIE